MDHRQGQGEEEGQEHLGEYGPAAHLLRGAQPGQNAVTGGVVRRLGELLEGQHRRRREKKDHAQIEPHEEDQDLGTHIFHIHPDPGAQVEGGLLRVEVGGSIGGVEGVLCGLLVAPVVCGKHLAPGREAGGCLIGDHGQPGEGAVARENGLPTQRGERGRGQRGLSLHRHQGVVVAQGHRGVRLLVGKAGEDGIIIIEEKVQAVLQQGVRVEAGLGEPGGDVHPDGVAAVVLDGEVIGGGGGGALLNGVVEAHAAGGDPDGQQQEQTDHRHGEIGGVDAAVELPQHKHIETFVVELFPALHHPEEKARERAEKQQGP